MEYQAHIFWTDDAGHTLALSMRKILVSLDCRLSDIVQTNNHSSYSATYHSRVKPVVERYLINNHADLSVLIHENGNLVLDARWLGRPIV